MSILAGAGRASRVKEPAKSMTENDTFRSTRERSLDRNDSKR